MEGVTTAIVAFLFVCVIFPTLVKHKPQYYAAFAAVVIVILLSGLEAVVHSGAFLAFATFMIALMQVSAMILLILSVGGLTLRQWAGDVTEAIEVIRRGETTKEVIIPIRGDYPGTHPSAPPAKPAAPPPQTGPRVVLDDTDSSVPME